MIGVPLAVHISDGVLTWPWLAAGFMLAGLLVAGAMIRVRDEEIPRIALTTAAFFVASLIHVPVGPTSVHLLLNGLLGVIVGRRAPLAVLLGLTLQAVLFGHGGFTTIGVNTCVMALPALQPVALLIVAILATMATWMESRLGHASEFPAGLLVGMTAVLATLVLNAAVLLWGGAEDWHSIVLLVFVVHMPIAVVEGVILGFAVGFLARVKPEMLGGLSVDDALRAATVRKQVFSRSLTVAAREAPSPALLFAVVGLLWTAAPAQAHRLDADYRVRPDGKVQVESWFDVGGKAPAGAKVQVFRLDGVLLSEGALDEQGIFVFAPKEVENLKVVVSAGAGHRAEFVVSREKLRQSATEDPVKPVGGLSPVPTPLIDRSYQFPYKETLSGIGFLLALAAFVMSLRNMQYLRELKRAQEGAAPLPDGVISPPEIRLPAAPPTAPTPR
jgi:cobalt/nickel transport system permease protein